MESNKIWQSFCNTNFWLRGIMSGAKEDRKMKLLADAFDIEIMLALAAFFIYLSILGFILL